jgi:hypothetical protein
MLSRKELAVTRAYYRRLQQNTTNTADRTTTLHALCLVATYLSYEWQRAPLRWQWDPRWHCQAISSVCRELYQRTKDLPAIEDHRFNYDTGEFRETETERRLRKRKRRIAVRRGNPPPLNAFGR